MEWKYFSIELASHGTKKGFCLSGVEWLFSSIWYPLLGVIYMEITIGMSLRHFLFWKKGQKQIEKGKFPNKKTKMYTICTTSTLNIS